MEEKSYIYRATKDQHKAVKLASIQLGWTMAEFVENAIAHYIQFLLAEGKLQK